MAPSTAGIPHSFQKLDSTFSSVSPCGQEISLRSTTFKACTTLRRIMQTELRPTANISLQINKLAPCVSLKMVQATRTTTGIARRYRVSFFKTVGLSMSVRANTEAFVIRKSFNQQSSSYCSSRNLENHVILCGLIQYPKSSPNMCTQVERRKELSAALVSQHSSVQAWSFSRLLKMLHCSERVGVFFFSNQILESCLTEEE